MFPTGFWRLSIPPSFLGPHWVWTRSVTGADLIELFSLARSSGSLIVGPTFAGWGWGSWGWSITRLGPKDAMEMPWKKLRILLVGMDTWCFHTSWILWIVLYKAVLRLMSCGLFPLASRMSSLVGIGPWPSWSGLIGPSKLGTVGSVSTQIFRWSWVAGQVCSHGSPTPWASWHNGWGGWHLEI